ncbi:hypothetical protein A2819_02400 [Candidatus Azambacteria bacterium RIFCSPHIGHO2_01_FULL_40_24]|uniref:Uncharacterized protein n=1 Tax=Candidatus Azambacteria bacterium RIFCSPHIGHO2_01_FULL_40_24 TaxID=1797301 RepID=A0A1F5B550_9BACT|nr:MAG: hypothetical protein A2819_02400 [Candidatus Azambacteria bacterium RIFCSPHIGHO2_01_FULL_40_24]
MKTLIILAIILAILAIYFVFNTEKSLSLQDRGNAIPAGIDIGKSILNQVLNQAKKINPKIVNSDNGVDGSGVMQSKLTEEIKSKIGDIKDRILDETVNLIKTPIENKTSELFCPQK